MNMAQILPIREQKDVNPEKPGDYRTADGILHCGTCHEAKEFRITIPGFERVVPCICSCVQKERDEQKRRDEYEEKMRYIHRLKDSSMMAGKFRTSCFQSYQKRQENRAAYNVAVNYCKNWQEMKSQNQGILFYGPVGTGKSYTAACIANWLLDHAVPVIMTSFVKILQDVRSTEDESNYIAILNAASLLIIDDLGTERSTDYALEKVYNVIDSRIRANKPLILTTNIELQDMMNCEDIRYRRIYDRIFELCFPVEIAGTSFRKEEASKRFERMKEFVNREDAEE